MPKKLLWEENTMPEKNKNNTQNPEPQQGQPQQPPQQPVSIKEAAGGISYAQYKKRILNHYSKYLEYGLTHPMPSLEQMRQRYDNMSDE